jgi:membrane protease YdiL (CAAX protease family)
MVDKSLAPTPTESCHDSVAMAFLVLLLAGAIYVLGIIVFPLFRIIIRSIFPLTNYITVFVINTSLIPDLFTIGTLWLFITKYCHQPFWGVISWWGNQSEGPRLGRIPTVTIGIVVGVFVFWAGDFTTALLGGVKTDAPPSLTQLLAMQFASFLLAPFAEELLFRGLLYGSFLKAFANRKVGIWVASLAVMMLFTIAHLPAYGESLGAMIAMVELSLACTLLRAWTGQVAPAYLTHFVYNVGAAFSVLCYDPAKRLLNM